MPFDIDLVKICLRTGRTPGVKFDGISFPSLVPCTGSHLFISLHSSFRDTYHLSPLSTLRPTQSDHTPGLAGPSHPASIQSSSAVCPFVLRVCSSNAISLSSTSCRGLRGPWRFVELCCARLCESGIRSQSHWWRETHRYSY